MSLTGLNTDRRHLYLDILSNQTMKLNEFEAIRVAEVCKSPLWTIVLLKYGVPRYLIASECRHRILSKWVIISNIINKFYSYYWMILWYRHATYAGNVKVENERFWIKILFKLLCSRHSLRVEIESVL